MHVSFTFTNYKCMYHTVYELHISYEIQMKHIHHLILLSCDIRHANGNSLAMLTSNIYQLAKLS